MTRTAQCSCRAVTVTAEGDPVRISICYCYECQRRTGSVFGYQARFLIENITISGTTKEYVRVADDEFAAFRFCPECGSTLAWTTEPQPTTIAVAAGNFADRDFPAPTVAVFENRRHSWANMPGAPVEVVDPTDR